MSPETLERLAIKAGFIRTIDPPTGETCIATLRGGVPVDVDLRRFAALVAEECAKIAENSIEGHDHMALIHGERSAENIRTAFKVTLQDLDS